MGAPILQQFSGTIIGQDVEDLKWYFRTGGLSVFAESTFGAQLERAEMFARCVRQCSRCRGTGFVPSNPRKWRQTTEQERALMKFVGKPERKLERPFADKLCGTCDGRGMLVSARRQRRRGENDEVTAQPVGSSKRGNSEASVNINDADLARLGRVTRRLKIVAESSVGSVEILEAYYGPEWTTVADDKPITGIAGLFAVWPHTSAGKKLLRKNPHRLHPLTLLSNERQAQADKPEPNRGELLKACSEQAQELFAIACRAWNAAALATGAKPHVGANGVHK